MNSVKPFWQSKTLWMNIIAAVGLFVQSNYGYPVSPDVQMYALAAVNGILRLVTKDSVSLS